jgi:hypothetical protein
MVIRGIPLESWRPGVLVVEATLPMTRVSSYRSWEPILRAHGYRFATDNGINRFYLRDDLVDRLDRLQRPINVLDEFRRFEAVYLEGQAGDLRRRVEDLTGQARAAARRRESRRVHLEEARAAWEWGREQAARARADWERSARRAGPGAGLWAAALARIEEAGARERDGWQREREQWERERAALQDESGHHLRLLAEAHDRPAAVSAAGSPGGSSRRRTAGPGGSGNRRRPREAAGGLDRSGRLRIHHRAAGPGPTRDQPRPCPGVKE